MSTSRQSLLLDLDKLIPGEALSVGGANVIIKPLNIEQIAIISKKLSSMGTLLSDEGVTWDNYTEHSNLFKIAVLLINQFPDILEEISNIDMNDLKKLPLEYIIPIVEKVISVNLKSKDVLVKNFESLTKNLRLIQENENPLAEKLAPIKKQK